MTVPALVAQGADGSKVTMSTTPDATGNAAVGSSCITDPVTGQKAQVAQFHNADNQSPGGTSYGLLTGGVAQLLNILGNLDRQRETGIDNAPPTGISSGAASFAMAFKTSSAASIAAGSAQVVTPAAMSGKVGNVPWAIQVGSVLSVDTAANQEYVLVTAVTSTTFTATFSKTHSTTPVPISGFVFNQGRDAAGENDGASGSGTAVAAEYEFNGGDPSGGNYDRARSVNGKGFITQTISAGGGAASTSLTVGGNTGLQPGMKVLLYKSSTFPAGGSFESVNVDLAYVAGTNTVPLASAIIGAVGYDTLAYDGFAALGPGLSGFLPFGVGIEEEALYDPVSGKFYLERAATQDAMPAANIVAEAPSLWNGATMDRQRGNVDTGAVITLTAAAVNGTSSDQTNFNGRGLQLGINITTITGTTPTITVTVQGKDTASGQYYTLLASAALNATGFTLLTVYPGAPSTANVSSPQVLPRTWRISYTITGTSPAVTATIGASVIV